METARHKTGGVSWRAWLGAGDADAMDQIGQAEFDTMAAAQSWVERELRDTDWRQRDGRHVFGSIDRGTYTVDRPGDDPGWEPDLDPAGMLDADFVDGRITWRCPVTVTSSAHK